MGSPTNELRAAIIARLKADGGVAGIVGTKVFDRVKSAAKMPYVVYGATDVRRAEGTGQRCTENHVTLHAWSVEPNATEDSALADAMVEALHDVSLDLPTHTLISLEHRQTRVFLDPDGLTTHVVVEVVGFLQRP